MKKLLSLLFVILAIFSFTHVSYADTFAHQVSPRIGDLNGYTVSDEKATDYIPTDSSSVEVTFSGLPTNVAFNVCVGSQYGIFDAAPCTLYNKNNGELRLRICGAGGNAGSLEALDPAKDRCNGDHRFQTDQDYYIYLFSGTDVPSSKDLNIGNGKKTQGNIQTDKAAATIHLHALAVRPKVTFDPDITNGGKIPAGSTLKVILESDTLALGGTNENDYAIHIYGGSFDVTQCVTIDKAGVPVSKEFGQGSPPFVAGDYKVDVKTETQEVRNGCYSEGSTLSIVSGFSIDSSGNVAPTIQPLSGDSRFDVNPALPNNPTPPCNAALDATGNCPTFDSAIGLIDTNPQAFISNLFRILLGLSGGIAVILIIYAGYRVATAGGDAKAVQAARETMTSAVIGLLFLIFSLVILEVIGVDILHIPGLISTPQRSQQIPTAKTNH